MSFIRVFQTLLSPSHNLFRTCLRLMLIFMFVSILFFCFVSRVVFGRLFQIQCFTRQASHVSRPHAHKACRGNRLTGMQTYSDLTMDRRSARSVTYHYLVKFDGYQSSLTYNAISFLFCTISCTMSTVQYSYQSKVIFVACLASSPMSL